MKLIVAREVERFMFRPGLQERARYYCAVFLNQLVLSHNPAQGDGKSACRAAHCSGSYRLLFALLTWSVA